MRSMPAAPAASLVSQRRWPWMVTSRGATIWKSASKVVLVDGTMTPIRLRRLMSRSPGQLVGLVDETHDAHDVVDADRRRLPAPHPIEDVAHRPRIERLGRRRRGHLLAAGGDETQRVVVVADEDRVAAGDLEFAVGAGVRHRVAELDGPQHAAGRTQLHGGVVLHA